MRECDDQYPWLGEFLTEYVDGTMDPASRAAFEECLRGNPALAGFVERLRMTRSVLCGYGCDVHAPCNLREQLHARLLREGLLTPESIPGTPLPLDTPSPSALPTLRTTLLLLACAMGAALFTARTTLDRSPDTTERAFADLPPSPSPARAMPVSAHLVYGEPRVPTRADSMRRARRLAEGAARMVP